MLVKSFYSFISTFSTLSGPSRGDIEIRSRQRVSVLAMCFSVVYGTYASSFQYILSLRNSLKVSGVNTMADVTDMVYHFILRDRAFKNFVRCSMRQIMLVSKSHTPVPCLFMDFSSPQPTTIRTFSVFVFKTFSNCFIHVTSRFVEHYTLYLKLIEKANKTSEVCFA